MLTECRQKEVVKAARSWVGVPWKHQGRDRRGVDCVGLIVNVADECGLKCGDYVSYTEFERDWTLILKAARTLMTKDQRPMLGSVLLFDGGAHVPHVAIVGDRGKPFSLIHSHRERGKVVEAKFDSEWVKKVRGSFSFCEV